MKTKVRAAVPADAPDLARLCAEVQAWHAELHPEFFNPAPEEAALASFFEAQIADPDVRIFLAVAGNVAQGYLFARHLHRLPGLFHIERRRLMIEHVGVAAPHRRQGVARLLFEAALAEARAAGCDDLYLDTWEENAGAHAAFEAMGFSPQRRLYARLT